MTCFRDFNIDLSHFLLFENMVVGLFVVFSEDLRRFEQQYLSHIATWKQEITNLWKFKWRGRGSNPGPLAPQAKSLTTRPSLLPSKLWNRLGK